MNGYGVSEAITPNGLAKKRSHVERFKLLTGFNGYAF